MFDVIGKRRWYFAFSLLITIFIKIFPLLAVWEVAEEKEGESVIAEMERAAKKDFFFRV